MIKTEDLGVLGYGGVVTGLEAWDEKRVEEGTLTKGDIFKQASFWGYVVPGGVCLLTNALGFMRKYEQWIEPISHGFMYGFPSFMRDLIAALGTEEEGSSAARRRSTPSSQTQQQAQRLLAEARKTGQYQGAGVGAAQSISI